MKKETSSKLAKYISESSPIKNEFKGEGKKLKGAIIKLLYTYLDNCLRVGMSAADKILETSLKFKKDEDDAGVWLMTSAQATLPEDLLKANKSVDTIIKYIFAQAKKHGYNPTLDKVHNSVVLFEEEGYSCSLSINIHNQLSLFVEVPTMQFFDALKPL